MDSSASVETVQLNYKKLGSGQALIILHGLFGSLDNWMTLAKKWSEDYEVWLIDQRNHGKSAHSTKHSYLHMAADLARFIEEHKIDQPIILGHSMGGKTAMEFAVQHADKLAKLIVVDIAPVSYQVHHWQIIDALESIDVEHLENRQEADQQLSSQIKEKGIRQFLLKNLYRKSSGGYDWRFNLSVLKNEILPISEWAVSDKEYKGETLFIKGENSSYILPQHGAEIVKKFPNYQLEEIPNAGHWVHAEAPTNFVGAVNRFLNET